MPEETAVLHSVQQIEHLIQRLERLPDPALRADMQQLVRTLMTLHGTALGRLITLITQAGEIGQTLLTRCVQDEVVASVLLLYDLHPTSFAALVTGPWQ